MNRKEGIYFSVMENLVYGSGWVSRKHAAFAPAITRRGNSFAFPLPTVASIPSRLPASPSRAYALRPRGHTPSAPPTDLWQATNQQKRLGFRLRSPLPSVEEPCPLSLQTVFSTPSLILCLYHGFVDVFIKRSKDDEPKL